MRPSKPPGKVGYKGQGTERIRELEGRLCRELEGRLCRELEGRLCREGLDIRKGGG